MASYVLSTVPPAGQDARQYIKNVKEKYAVAILVYTLKNQPKEMISLDWKSL